MKTVYLVCHNDSEGEYPGEPVMAFLDPFEAENYLRAEQDYQVEWCHARNWQPERCRLFTQTLSLWPKVLPVPLL